MDAGFLSGILFFPQILRRLNTRRFSLIFLFSICENLRCILSPKNLREKQEVSEYVSAVE